VYVSQEEAPARGVDHGPSIEEATALSAAKEAAWKTAAAALEGIPDDDEELKTPSTEVEAGVEKKSWAERVSSLFISLLL